MGEALIPLYRGGVVVAHAIVDQEDFEWLSCWNWYKTTQGYVERSAGYVGGKKCRVRMHRLILGLELSEMYGDHINRNKLDNRRSNLRIVTPAQNAQNRVRTDGKSTYRGVYWDYRKRRWVAQGTLNGYQKKLGRFTSEEEAAACARAWRQQNMPFANEGVEGLGS